MGVNIKAFHKNNESKIKLFHQFLAFLYVTARNVSLNFCYILFSANFQTKKFLMLKINIQDLILRKVIISFLK